MEEEIGGQREVAGEEESAGVGARARRIKRREMAKDLISGDNVALMTPALCKVESP